MTTPVTVFQGVAAVVAAVWWTSIACADTLAFKCEELDAGKPSEMTLTYDGYASGTLKVKASFGAMELPATMEAREREIDGIQLKATGIRAFGPATVTMPDRSALEGCIAAKTEPEQRGDEDIFSLLLESCRPTAPLGAAPIEVKASVEIAIMHADSAGQPPDVEVYVKRTYLGNTDATGGPLTIESLPPPRCSLVQQ